MASDTLDKLELVAPASPAKLKLDDLHDDHVDDVHEHEESFSGSPKRGKKKRDNATLRKAPQAPKRFKSSYICFFMDKQPEIKESLGDKATVTEISKRSAEMWRTLPAEERVHWDEVAAKDKQRYLVEKASYTGPWQVPWKRAKKDPSAPKRPMSAFLYFSQGRRSKIKQANQELKNTEVSRMLGEMWRNATEEDRKPYVDKERQEREKYKIAIADWRVEYEKKKEEEKKQQAAQQAQQAQWAQQHQQQFQSEVVDPNVGNGQHVQYQQPPPYAIPPPGSQFAYLPPTTPHFYGGYPQNLGPFQYPMNGKQPVILGPNGMPHFQPQPPPLPSDNIQPMYAQQPPAGPNFDEAQAQTSPETQPFDYLPDQIPEPQTAE